MKNESPADRIGSEPLTEDDIEMLRGAIERGGDPEGWNAHDWFRRLPRHQGYDETKATIGAVKTEARQQIDAAQSALRRIREGVAGLRELSDAATPGEWTLCPDLSGCACGHGTQSIDARAGEVVIAEFRDLTDPPNEAESNNTEPVETRRANAALIVEAVAFVRSLLIDTEIEA